MMDLMTAVERYATAMKLAERYGNERGDVDTANNAWRVAREYGLEIESLRARVQELEKDAARYRWLRNMDHWPATFDSHSAPEPIRGPELDAAIDAAMQKGEK